MEFQKSPMEKSIEGYFTEEEKYAFTEEERMFITRRKGVLIGSHNFSIYPLGYLGNLKETIDLLEPQGIIRYIKGKNGNISLRKKYGEFWEDLAEINNLQSLRKYLKEENNSEKKLKISLTNFKNYFFN